MGNVDMWHRDTGAQASASRRAYDRVWKRRGWRLTPPRTTSSTSVEADRDSTDVVSDLSGDTDTEQEN